MAVKTKGKPSETPLMKQYLTIKAKYPDAVLLFRVGDFYETFGSDAIKASNILGIVLTKRQNGAAASIELAGFPHHSLDTYLPKLVRAGQRVAICDQLEDPKLTKKIVKRGVTELVTPGVSFNDNVLEHKSNNFLAALHFEKNLIGVAFLDVSTGEFLTAEGRLEYIAKLLQSFAPSEVLFERSKQKRFEEAFGDKFCTFKLEDWVFTSDFSKEILLNHFDTKSLKGFGIEQLHCGTIASGVALHYLRETQHDRVTHITNLSRIEEEKYMWLDRFTIRNLELIQPGNQGAKTLMDVMDKTISPMGARLMKRWIVLPLKDKKPIEDRLNIVAFFTSNQSIIDVIGDEISKVGDLERIISKVAVFRVGPREVVQLKRALQAIVPIKTFCKKSGNKSLESIGNKFDTCDKLVEKIERDVFPDPPALLAKGNVIATGVNEELDELRNISANAKEFLNKIQIRETERTGISSLKISFNNVFGYYIEVRNTHKDKVPEDWIRKQTLVNAERYITEELKEFESKILGAEAKIAVLESKLYQELMVWMQDSVSIVQINAGLLAHLDVLLSFSKIALAFDYKRPKIFENDVLEIKNGRHPVIEQQLPVGESYITNDIYLDAKKQQIIMITGPNMAGKSALLRQTALIVLMAQMGSFVPAEYSNIGLIDKIFTRVGASDNISSGESTFMVEMNETASILNNVSENSLILLDEIGRGTSTYDGISIAWAIAEFLHEHQQFKPKTLFATHYHELNEMSNSFERIKNFNVSVREVNNKVIFMRKLISGGSEHSFGIHVAKMAGMPKKVVTRANRIMSQLEKSHAVDDVGVKTKKIKKEDLQFQLFEIADPVLNRIREEISNTDVNSLTPIEALMKLNEIKNLIES